MTESEVTMMLTVILLWVCAILVLGAFLVHATKEDESQ